MGDVRRDLSVDSASVRPATRDLGNLLDSAYLDEALEHLLLCLFELGDVRGNECNAQDLTLPTLWRLLSDAGRRMIVINVPVTYPPEPVNGLLISGMMTPNTRVQFTHPPELAQELEQAVGRYPVFTPLRRVDRMGPRAFVDRLIDTNTFWQHSISCGVLARLIGEKRLEQNVERFFVMGLLHDVGKIPMFSHIPKPAKAALLRSRRGKIPLYAAESEVIGFTHAAVGAALAKSWRMSAGQQEAVSYHHLALELEPPSCRCRLVLDI